MILEKKYYSKLIELALAEDLGEAGDITTDATITEDFHKKAFLYSKEEGILCGRQVFEDVFLFLDKDIKIQWLRSDGDVINFKEMIAIIEGSIKNILKAERTALNFLQRMSGIATTVNKLQSKISQYNVNILDTRKTIPAFRMLDKYSVFVGGGINHRIGLFDMILIKENHKNASGGLENAVKNVINKYGKKYKIEVETENLDEVEIASKLDIDVIMFDNFTIDMIKSGVNIVRNNNKNIKIEVSGNVTPEKLEEIAKTGIDYISMGFLTHSVRAFDFSIIVE